MKSAATALKAKFSEFRKEVPALVARLYSERATHDELHEVLHEFSLIAHTLLEEGDKTAMIHDVATLFMPKKPVLLPKLMFEYHCPECSKTHLVFGNTSADWENFAKFYEDTKGSEPRLILESEFNAAKPGVFLYGLPGLPKRLKFKFQGTVGEYVEHAEPIGAILLDAVAA